MTVPVSERDSDRDPGPAAAAGAMPSTVTSRSRHCQSPPARGGTVTGGDGIPWANFTVNFKLNLAPAAEAGPWPGLGQPGQAAARRAAAAATRDGDRGRPGRQPHRP